MGLKPAELVDCVVGLVAGAAPADAALVRGRAAVVIPREALAAAFPILRDDPALRFTQLMDVTAVDYLGRTPRFAVVYQFLSMPLVHRLQVTVPVSEDDPIVPSAVPFWKSANWGEREAFDMFGITFAGHPDLRRILMYEEFVGHPLRKDYDLNLRQPLVPERDPIARPWYPKVKEA